MLLAVVTATEGIPALDSSAFRSTHYREDETGLLQYAEKIGIQAGTPKSRAQKHRFVTGKPVQHSSHVDYVPSVFSYKSQPVSKIVARQMRARKEWTGEDH